MHFDHMSFRTALLGSALALVAFTPAAGAKASHADHRALAATGGRPAAAMRLHNGTSAGVNATYTVLHDFAGGPNDGGGSGATVTLDDEGNIYGTTDFGGANSNGTIFKLASDGTQTLLHSFSGSDGSAPDGGVTLMANGDLYGTAGSGGSTGNGVLFKLAADGTYTVLHNFDGTNDGSFIRGDLVHDKLGNFYGTALFGGLNSDGTVFKYAADGTFSVVHTFNGADGEFPEHGVVRDSAGNLYGVTAFGGDSDEGTVYKIASDGTFSTLHSFTGGADGGFLYGGLDIDKDGNLYGSTVDGGANAFGTVFKIAPDGTLTTLYNFTGGRDGGGSEADMLVSGKKLYGVATSGGDPSCQCGGIFVIKPNGKEKMLHAFTGTDGGGYSAGLTRHNRVFYGTTASGGTTSNGVVFSLTKD